LLIKRRGSLDLHRVSGAQFHGVLDWVVASALSTACWLAAASAGTWKSIRSSSGVALSGVVVLYRVEIARQRVVKPRLGKRGSRSGSSAASAIGVESRSSGFE